jgi:hypothetical protein
MTTKQIVVVPRSTITVKGPEKKEVVIKDPIEVDRFYLNIVREINELRADFVALDHGDDLAGLTDDDHVAYHTNARGDARYYTQAQVTAAVAVAESQSYFFGTML